MSTELEGWMLLLDTLTSEDEYANGRTNVLYNGTYLINKKIDRLQKANNCPGGHQHVLLAVCRIWGKQYEPENSFGNWYDLVASKAGRFYKESRMANSQ